MFYPYVKRTAARVLPFGVILVLGHFKVHGKIPNILRPKTFSEKVLYRNLFDRRPILSKIADKAAVRGYVAERLGSDAMAKLLFVGEEPDTIPFPDLPKQFVVKPTHGSGWVRLIHDKDAVDWAELIATCKDWLRRDYVREGFESVYRNIKPRIIVEELIDDRTGQMPSDYKMFVFHGRVAVIEVDVGRGADQKMGLYTPEWELLPVQGSLTSFYSRKANKYDGLKSPSARPPHLQEMIAAAETLGQEWDFIRVDFFDTSERWYLGEITLTPAGGRERFTPASHDRWLGSLWKNPQDGG